jgi:flagellar basal-body rod protein FlgB
MNDFLFDSLHGGLGSVLDLRAAQHALTASNLANADTPGFKAKVIPFDQVLAEAVENSDQLNMRRTMAEHVSAPGGSAAQFEVEELEAPPWAANGNSVIPERETVRMNENAIMYDAIARGLSVRLKTLSYAASNGRMA